MVFAQPIINLHTDGFEWGWSFFVAVGTLALACATGWLAWKTRAVADETGKVAQETQKLAMETTELAKRTSEDVAAQFRPAIVTNVEIGPDPVRYNDAQGTLDLRIQNSGHGPALDVQALVPQNNVAAEPWQRGALATGAIVWLRFGNVWPVNQKITAELQYRSLGDETYTTAIVVKVDDVPGNPRPLIENVIVATAPQPESSDREWLRE